MTAQGLRADRPPHEMGHDAFGKLGQLVLKHLARHAHHGPQVDALEAGVLLLDTPQIAVLDRAPPRPPGTVPAARLTSAPAYSLPGP